MVNFGPLAAEIISLVWGTPPNFNGFGVLATLLHGTLVVGVSQTAALNRGHHLYSAGRPSRWALAHISSIVSDDCTFAVQVTARQASQWCSAKGGVPSFETSARDAVNVEQAFYEVARCALALEQQAEQYSDFPDQIRLGAGHQSHRDREQCAC